MTKAISCNYMMGALGLLLLVATGTADASSRHFTYTHESSVTHLGHKEIEAWNTIRMGRKKYYRRFDHRLEFEMGIAQDMQAALYLQLSATSEDKGGERINKTKWNGIAIEWKWKLLDPVADAIGLAIYLEPHFKPNELKAEGKIILDKRIGDFIGAFNGTFEYEWEFEHGETERKAEVDFTLGAGYFITKEFFAGLETRLHNEFPAGDDPIHSVLFLGPVFSYDPGTWFATLTILPQLAGLKDRTPDSSLVLGGHEKVEVRLLLGLDL